MLKKNKLLKKKSPCGPIHFKVYIYIYIYIYTFGFHNIYIYINAHLEAAAECIPTKQ